MTSPGITQAIVSPTQPPLTQLQPQMQSSAPPQAPEPFEELPNTNEDIEQKRKERESRKDKADKNRREEEEGIEQQRMAVFSYDDRDKKEKQRRETDEIADIKDSSALLQKQESTNRS